MKNDSANQSRKRMLLALGAVIPLVVVAGCSSATTEEAVADRGTIENSGAGSGANEGSTEPGSITLSNATRKAGIRDVRILIYQRDVTGQTETATAWRIGPPSMEKASQNRPAAPIKDRGRARDRDRVSGRADPGPGGKSRSNAARATTQSAAPSAGVSRAQAPADSRAGRGRRRRA